MSQGDCLVIDNFRLGGGHHIPTHITTLTPCLNLVDAGNLVLLIYIYCTEGTLHIEEHIAHIKLSTVLITTIIDLNHLGIALITMQLSIYR